MTMHSGNGENKIDNLRVNMYVMCILCIDDAFQLYEETGEQFAEKIRQGGPCTV